MKEGTRPERARPGDSQKTYSNTIGGQQKEGEGASCSHDTSAMQSDQTQLPLPPQQSSVPPVASFPQPADRQQQIWRGRGRGYPGGGRGVQVFSSLLEYVIIVDKLDIWLTPVTGQIEFFSEEVLEEHLEGSHSYPEDR